MTIIKTRDLPDYFDVTGRFYAHCGTVPESWAKQESDTAARILIHNVLGIFGVPCEGSLGDECELGFRGEEDGVGYLMTYTVSDPDENGFVRVSNVSVIRDKRWDGEPTDPDEGFEMEDEEEPIAEPDYKRAFNLVMRRIEIEHARYGAAYDVEGAEGYRQRATALSDLYMYASGVMEAQGVELPALG